MLEVSGRYEEIFTPDMTVSIRSIGSARQTALELDGLEAVQGFYQSLIDNNSTVMLLEHENIIVNDWGFASEALFHSFIPAETAATNGHEVPDINAKYIESRWVCMMWHFDEAGRMIGERVYQAPTASLEKCPEEDFLTLIMYVQYSILSWRSGVDWYFCSILNSVSKILSKLWKVKHE